MFHDGEGENNLEKVKTSFSPADSSEEILNAIEK
jgi:hypothetical protein